MQEQQNNIWQPLLEGQYFRLRPLEESDFEALYKAASDPMIWEQHPDFERYKIEKFKRYFDSGIQSQGAFVILDQATDEIVGSSRYTNYLKDNSSVEIGYTFLTRKYWGGPNNRDLKSMMLKHAFKHVEKAYFVVGKDNHRSRKAMEKIGGVLIKDLTQVPLTGDLSVSVAYVIEKNEGVK